MLVKHNIFKLRYYGGEVKKKPHVLNATILPSELQYYH
jgi:hypothetical protein